MKIGVVTYWESDDNYGQQLQCFALQTFLRLRGHDVFLIKYAPKKNTHTSSLKKFIKYFACLFNPTLRKAHTLWKNEQLLKEKNKKLNKQRLFESFRFTYIKSTDIVYQSIDELRSNPPEADVYITGSDQVWNNPLSDPNTAGWFLDFGTTQRKISYAASMGRNLNAVEMSSFSELLKKFYAVGVRELTLCDLCRQCGYENAELVLDPTLLLKSDSYPIENKVGTEEPYMFVYVLNVCTSQELYWDSLDFFVKQNSLKVNVVGSSGYFQARNIIPDVNNICATIPQWLGFIRNARCVVTTSFHGIVFSVLMHRPFLAILLTNRYSKGNNRIIDFLMRIGLSERIFDPKIPVEKQMNAPIDWSVVDHKIEDLRMSSFDFLDRALQ